MNYPDVLKKEVRHGTHRIVPPKITLANIFPHLRKAGITRCADVTGLDRLGIPVYCAIRPVNQTIQVSNGKAVYPTAAKVSALMEAFELFHFENPCVQFVTASTREMSRRYPIVSPRKLPTFRTDIFFSDKFVFDWVQVEELHSNRTFYIPAAAIFLRPPYLYRWSTNGLASGNHPVEAILHALYEVIERDATTRAENGTGYRLMKNRRLPVKLESILAPSLRKLIGRIESNDVKLLLVGLRSCIPVHTFMAVLLDRKPFFRCSVVNVGHGTHLSPMVAATRAITEAAQSRLTFIHGSREDISKHMYEVNNDDVYEYYDRIQPETSFEQFTDLSSEDLRDDLSFVLAKLRDHGYSTILCADLTRKEFQIPVVKVVVPGLLMYEH